MELRARAIQLVAVLVGIAGVLFTLQGLQLLPSRLMYGRPEWVAIGAVMVAVSAVVLWWMTKATE